MRQVTLITTGGTIEKTYDERSGSLENRRSIVGRMLQRLRLEGTSVRIIELMSKDSLVMTEADREAIVEAARGAGAMDGNAMGAGGIVILHGTDTLCLTGERLAAAFPRPRVPIVLTGAMRPYEMKRSDALQNLTEALFGAGVMEPGVYVAAHGRALRFPGVVKDRDRGTFVAGGHGSAGGSQ
ncbi:MAG: asparaginase [Phycisphaeraceae bacterium]|nr:asparaginase [Phycisphaeraceae bacterium]